MREGISIAVTAAKTYVASADHPVNHRRPRIGIGTGLFELQPAFLCPPVGITIIPHVHMWYYGIVYFFLRAAVAAMPFEEKIDCFFPESLRACLEIQGEVAELTPSDRVEIDG